MAAKSKKATAPTFDREKVSNEILTRMIGGESLRKICREDEMPNIVTFLEWVAKDPALGNQYAYAMQQRAEAMFEEMLDIADDGSNDTYVDENGNKKTDWDVVGRSRLRVDTRKWALARMSPKKYGDRQILAGDANAPLNLGTIVVPAKNELEADPQAE